MGFSLSQRLLVLAQAPARQNAARKRFPAFFLRGIALAASLAR
jgi:hypothetical protein